MKVVEPPVLFAVVLLQLRQFQEGLLVTSIHLKDGWIKPVYESLRSDWSQF